MKGREIVVRLTRQEAETLTRAASGVLEHPVALAATFPRVHERAAAVRAYCRVLAVLSGDSWLYRATAL